MKKKLRIVSRKSPLALWQANFVKDQLQLLYPNLEISILGITTEGDKNLNIPLTEIGGKGLFVKELEEHLLDNSADIAVHSLKDIPAALPTGLEIAVILKREDPRDAFVSALYPTLKALPPNARIGTSSFRRQSQILALRKDLRIEPVRGNVDTRIQKLDNGEYDALLLAVAGLKRLGLEKRIQTYLPADQMLSAVGQGALCIECRIQDDATKRVITHLHHAVTAHCVIAERSMNAVLGGGCQLPVAGLAIIDAPGMLKLQGMVGNKAGTTLLKATAEGKPQDAIAIGEAVAKTLLKMGAKAIIDACLSEDT